MFSGYFQKKFFDYHLLESIVVSRDACYRLVSHKVLIRDPNILEGYFTKDEFLVSLSSMKNRKSLGIDVFYFEYYKVMWDTMGDVFCNLAHKFFSTWSLSKTLNQGLIKLILSNTSRYFIGEWWLITLLRIFNRIMAKDLPKRVL